VVTALGYGTTGLSVGQRVFGLSDSYRGGTLAEYVAIEAPNLAPLPGAVDFTVGASVAMPGLTAWQGLFEHGRLQAGQSVLAHGAAGAVSSMVTQLAREFGAYVIGTGRAADRQAASRDHVRLPRSEPSSPARWGSVVKPGGLASREGLALARRGRLGASAVIRSGGVSAKSVKRAPYGFPYLGGHDNRQGHGGGDQPLPDVKCRGLHQCVEYAQDS